MKLRKKTAIRILTAFMALAMVSTNVINTSFITVSAVETVTKTASSSSIEGYCGENVQYKLENGTLTISGKGDMYNYNYKGTSYSSVQYTPWKDYTEEITNVVILDGITGIGSYTFYDCSYVTSVQIADTVSYIGDYAFCNVGRYGSYDSYGNYTGFSYLTLPTNLSSIGEAAFQNCSISTLEFKSNVSYISKNAFFNCSGLANITIPCTFDKNVFSANDTGINADRSSDNFYISGEYSGSSEYTFNYSHQNQNNDVVLSGSCGEKAQYTLTCDGTLKITGTGDMYNYQNKYVSYTMSYGYTPWKGYEKDIKSIVIDSGITNIGNYAFYDCSYVTSVQIADTVSYIGDYAFCNVGRYGSYDSYGNYTGFSYLTLPSNLYSIGEAAFQNCPVSTLEFKSNVSYIYDKAFFNCSSLSSITIPCTFDKDVFSANDTGINADRSSDNFYISGEYSGSSEYTFNYSHQNQNNDVVLSGSCGEKAQYTLTCDGTLKITGTGDMYNYQNKYVSYTMSYGYTPWKGYEKDIKSIVIDSGITNIGSYAFYDCSYVTSVQIADTVSYIGDYAFCNVGKYGSYDSYGNYTGFSYLTLPSNLYSIGEAAFQNCPVSTLEFKSNVSSIYKNAFFNCSSLSSITIPCTFDKDVFSANDTGINADRSSDNFYISGEYSGSSEYTFNYSHQNQNNDVILSGYCGEQAQYSLTCNGTLKITGTGDMYNYQNKYVSYTMSYGYTPWKGYEKDIKSIVIDNGITNIGSYAFYDCSYVTSVQIAESVTSIGDYAFYNVGRYSSYDSYGNYTGFSYLTLPSQLYSIGESAFQNCPVSTLEFKSNVSSIYKNAFFNCSSLSSITIPCTFDKDVFSANDTGINADRSSDNFYISGEYSGSSEYTFNYSHQHENSDIIISGYCGENAQYALTCDGTLKITGTGSMYNYNNRNGSYNGYSYGYTPWKGYEKDIKSIIIGDGITGISSYAFYNCSYVTSAQIADTVSYIGDYAFCNVGTYGGTYNSYGMYTSFGYLALPTNLSSIGEAAFRSCPISTLEFKSNVSYIYENAFYNCSSLSNITIPCTFDKDVFTDNYSGIYAERSSDVFYVSSDYSSPCSNEFNYSHINENNDIYLSGTCGSDVNYQITCDGTLKISGSGYMYDYNFKGSPYSSTTFTPWKGYEGIIKKIVVENGVNHIGDYAFYRCYNVQSVQIAESVSSIGTNAFGRCSSLSEITIPESISSVSESTFEKCNNLTTVYLPRNINISYKAFADCFSLLDVYYSGSPKDWAGVEIDDENNFLTNAAIHYGDVDITLNKTEAVLGVSQTCTLKATVEGAAEFSEVTWSSSNKNVASVNSSGKISAKATGTATITAKAKNGKTVSCKITVNPAPESVSINKTAVNIGVGQNYSLSTELTPSNAVTYCSWSSSDTSIATVNSSGQITGKKVGTATITVKTSNGKTASCKVNVKKAPTGISFDTTELSLNVDEEYTLVKTLSPANSATSYKWKSSNVKVATINSSGKIVAKGKGTAVITVTTYNGKTASCTVNVTE